MTTSSFGTSLLVRWDREMAAQSMRDRTQMILDLKQTQIQLKEHEKLFETSPAHAQSILGVGVEALKDEVQRLGRELKRGES